MIWKRVPFRTITITTLGTPLNAYHLKKDFFSHLGHIVSGRIDYFTGQDQLSSKHAFHISNINKPNRILSKISPKIPNRELDKLKIEMFLV